MAGIDLRLAIKAARVGDFFGQRSRSVFLRFRSDRFQLQLQRPPRAFVMAALAGLAELAAFVARIETRLEQLDQQSRDQRITVECRLHVWLRKRHAGLQQIFAIAAQHRDLAPVHARGQDQSIEAVALGIATPDALERLLECCADRGEIDVRLRNRDLEILNLQRMPVGVDRVGMLGKNSQPHVFHHRQRIRQIHRAALAQQLEAQPAIARRTIQPQLQIVRTLQALGQFEIGDRAGWRHRIHVTGRQIGTVTPEQCRAGSLAVACDQLIAQFVVPVAHDACDLRLESGLVDFDGDAGFRAHDQMQLRQWRFADLDGGVDAFAVQRVLQQVFDVLTIFGVEAIAWNVDQRREETTVAIAAQEQSAARAFLQTQYTHAGTQQFVGAGLEQFIARQRLDDVLERLAAMAVGAQTRARHHLRVALAHQRNVPRPPAVGAGGEQSEEAFLRDRLALGIEAQHADVIHVAGAMHARARIGLGQDQRLRRAGLLVRGQAADWTWCGTGLRTAQQTESGTIDRRQHFVLAALDHAVFAIA